MLSPDRAGSDGRRLARLAFAAAVAVQLVVLYAPSSGGAGGASGLDKVVHVGVFAAVALTGARAGFPTRRLAALLLAHAVLSELVQAAVLPQRSGDALDVVADSVGVLVGLGLARGAALRARRSPPTRNRRSPAVQPDRRA